MAESNKPNGLSNPDLTPIETRIRTANRSHAVDALLETLACKDDMQKTTARMIFTRLTSTTKVMTISEALASLERLGVEEFIRQNAAHPANAESAVQSPLDTRDTSTKLREILGISNENGTTTIALPPTRSSASSTGFRAIRPEEERAAVEARAAESAGRNEGVRVDSESRVSVSPRPADNSEIRTEQNERPAIRATGVSAGARALFGRAVDILKGVKGSDEK